MFTPTIQTCAAPGRFWREDDERRMVARLAYFRANGQARPISNYFEQCGVEISSFTTAPPFITNFTCCSTVMSASGSPSTAIRSA